MIVYLGAKPNDKYFAEIGYVKALSDTYPDLYRNVGVCLSYLELKDKDNVDEILNVDITVFLDSGAFSALNRGVEIDLDAYINFLHTHKGKLAVYANLDVIGNPLKSLQNQQVMEKKGLEPLPCYHAGEPRDLFIHYIENYEYIGIGGVASTNYNARRKCFDKIFQLMCDSNGQPKKKIHVYGITALNITSIYPMYSCDGTTWKKEAEEYGRGFYLIDVPESKKPASMRVQRSPLINRRELLWVLDS